MLARITKIKPLALLAIALLAIPLFACASRQEPKLPRAQPAFMQWMSRQSLRAQAEEMIAEVSQSGRMWMNSSQGHGPKILLTVAPSWFEVNAAAFPPKHPLLRILASEAETLASMGFNGIYLGPTGERPEMWVGSEIDSGRRGKKGARRGRDSASMRFDPSVGTEEDFAAFSRRAEMARLQIGSDLLNAATGIGPDFLLACRKASGYSGLYAMLPVPQADWDFLPPASGEWDFEALDAAAVKALVEKGVLPKILGRDNLKWASPGGWAATGPVIGVDGKHRRWVYRYSGEASRPIMLWQDPSGLARQIFSGDIIANTGLNRESLVGIRLEPLTGLEAAPQKSGQEESQLAQPERSRKDGKAAKKEAEKEAGSERADAASEKAETDAPPDAAESGQAVVERSKPAAHAEAGGKKPSGPEAREAEAEAALAKPAEAALEKPEPAASAEGETAAVQAQAANAQPEMLPQKVSGAPDLVIQISRKSKKSARAKAGKAAGKPPSKTAARRGASTKPRATASNSAKKAKTAAKTVKPLAQKSPGGEQDQLNSENAAAPAGNDSKAGSPAEETLAKPENQLSPCPGQTQAQKAYCMLLADTRRRLAPALGALDEMAAEVHRYGGWAIQADALPPNVMEAVLAGLCDFCRDAATPALAAYALMSEDPAPLAALYKSWLECGVEQHRFGRGLNDWEGVDPRILEGLSSIDDDFELFEDLPANEAGLIPLEEIFKTVFTGTDADYASFYNILLAWRLGLPGMAFISSAEMEKMGENLAGAYIMARRDAKSAFTARLSALLKARRENNLAAGSLCSITEGKNGAIAILSALPEGGYWLMACNFGANGEKLEISLPRKGLAARDILSGQNLSAASASGKLPLSLDGRQARHVLLLLKAQNKKAARLAHKKERP